MVFVTVASVASLVTDFAAESWIIIGLNVGSSTRKHNVVRRNRNHTIFVADPLHQTRFSDYNQRMRGH